MEGWHTGREWIDTGNLVERVNAAALELGDVNQPGVREVVRRLEGGGASAVSRRVRGRLPGRPWGSSRLRKSPGEGLVRYAERMGELRFDRPDSLACTHQRVGEMLQLIAATREYQLA